jgi:hypothetical protein
MRGVIALEFIGEDRWAYVHSARTRGRDIPQYEAERLKSELVWRTKPWVARITGRSDRYDGLERAFMEGQIDYSQANSVGSRGVYLYFVVTPGVYEVYEHLSWKRSRRYFCQVTDDGSTCELTRAEVEQWLRNAGLA